MDAEEARRLTAAHRPAMERRLRNDINEGIESQAKQGFSEYEARFDKNEYAVIESLRQAFVKDGFDVKVVDGKEHFRALMISWSKEY